MKKLDELKSWLRTMQIVSVPQIKSWGDQHYFTSADVRCRELARHQFLEPISNEEAVLRGLVKRGNQPVRWYRVTA